MASDTGSKAVFFRDRVKTENLYDEVELSASDCIAPGKKIRGWFETMVREAYAVQRLTERAYFVGVSFYNAVFYVGDRGVLLIDPLSGPATQNLIAAVREVTALPIDTLVYTHYHLDHVEGAAQVAGAVAETGGSLNIVGTDLTRSRIEKFGGKIPLPDVVVTGHDGEFAFEGITVRLRTPEDGGHCPDNAMVFLKDDGVVQFDDMVEPGMMPFPKFGTQEDIIACEENLVELAGHDWRFVNGGHGNIGGKDDVRFYLDYFRDLREATGAVMERVKLADFVVPTHSHMGQWMNFLHAVSALAKEELRGKYGRYYGFEEAVPSHVEMMVDAIVSY